MASKRQKNTSAEVYIVTQTVLSTKKINKNRQNPLSALEAVLSRALSSYKRQSIPKGRSS